MNWLGRGEAPRHRAGRGRGGDSAPPRRLRRRAADLPRSRTGRAGRFRRRHGPPRQPHRKRGRHRGSSPRSSCWNSAGFTISRCRTPESSSATCASCASWSPTGCRGSRWPSWGRLGSAVFPGGHDHRFPSGENTPAGVPVAGINLRLVHAASGTVVWAGSLARTGTDRETFFGLGTDPEPRPVWARRSHATWCRASQGIDRPGPPLAAGDEEETTDEHKHSNIARRSRPPPAPRPSAAGARSRRPDLAAVSFSPAARRRIGRSIAHHPPDVPARSRRNARPRRESDSRWETPITARGSRDSCPTS